MAVLLKKSKPRHLVSYKEKEFLNTLLSPADTMSARGEKFEVR